MKRNFSLKAFMVFALFVAVITCLTWERFLFKPIKLEQVVMGQVTSESNSSNTALTLNELKSAIQRQNRATGSPAPPMRIENATIEEHESSVELPREVPLIGYAELRRTVYRCTVDGILTDGTSTQQVFLVEKNHFHLLDKNQFTKPTK